MQMGGAWLGSLLLLVGVSLCIVDTKSFAYTSRGSLPTIVFLNLNRHRLLRGMYTVLQSPIYYLDM
jgi:hypothetical protein